MGLTQMVAIALDSEVQWQCPLVQRQQISACSGQYSVCVLCECKADTPTPPPTGLGFTGPQPAELARESWAALLFFDPVSRSPLLPSCLPLG